MGLLFVYTIICKAQGIIINQDGKYGIADKKTGSMVQKAVYDTIIKDESSLYFFLKKGNKYGYTYCLNLNNQGLYDDVLDKYWVKSEFIFDDIKVHSSGIDGWADSGYVVKERDYTITTPIIDGPYLILKYKKDNKWGLIYIVARFATNPYGGRYQNYPGGLGKLTITEPKYDEIIESIRYSIHVAKTNGKYMVFQKSAHKIDKSRDKVIKKWEEIDYSDSFDTIPILIKTEEEEGKGERIICEVKRDGKWGLVELNPDTKSTTYILLCDCKSPIDVVGNIYFCRKTKENETIFYDRVTNHKFEIPHNDKLDFYSMSYFAFDTTLSKASYYQKRYIFVCFSEYGYLPIEYKKGSELYFYDLKNQKLKTVFKDTAAFYSVYASNLGVIVRKRTTQGSNYFYEYIDLESNAVKFTLTFDSTTVVYNKIEGDIYKYDLNDIYNYKSRIEKDGSYINSDCDKIQKLKINMETEIEEANQEYKKIKAHYDFVNKKFVRKKPRYFQRCQDLRSMKIF